MESVVLGERLVGGTQRDFKSKSVGQTLNQTADHSLLRSVSVQTCLYRLGRELRKKCLLPDRWPHLLALPQEWGPR